MVVIGFEITSAEDDADVGSNHRGEVVETEVNGGALALVNVCLPDFSLVDNLNLDAMLAWLEALSHCGMLTDKSFESLILPSLMDALWFV